MALSINANTFQFFTRNPRGGNAKELDIEDIEELKKIMKENSFGPLLAHAPYTLNMASYKEDTWDFAKRAFKDDLQRLEIIPCSLYNFHPGSHTGKGVEYGIERIKAIHLNDSMKELGSKKDRHAGIGEGTIGIDALINVIKHPQLKHLPFFLETPHEPEGHKREIEAIKNILKNG
ncbi:TIM barrel protein [Proteiniborus sp. MB09-C3]|uniref:TIM barrel protein n=1 Tax=Proteiniborus sp. MB09-C3 TaxID=3050072 RepID=UPI0025554914|nr:TIM barrel protein [Proteiniborus sp. MB09-C3]WIV13933.1 TIM barrel protein [Proteiniborus sp. MB09-C3]